MHKNSIQRKVSSHIHHKGHTDEIMNTDNKDREYARRCFGRAEGFELDILKRKLLIFEEEPSSPLQLLLALRLCFLSVGAQNWRGSKRETEEKEER